MRLNNDAKALLITGALCALVAVLVTLGKGEAKPAGSGAPLSATEYSDAAKFACKTELKRTLHDPSSAELPSYSDYAVTQPGDPASYLVTLRIRAKNGFGALRLAQASCVVRDIVFDSKGGFTYKAVATVTP